MWRKCTFAYSIEKRVDGLMVGRRGRQQTRHRNNISGCPRPEATQRIRDLINMHGMRSTSRSAMCSTFHTGFLTLLDLWPAKIGTVLCLSQNTEHKGKHQGSMLPYSSFSSRLVLFLDNFLDKFLDGWSVRGHRPRGLDSMSLVDKLQA